MCYILILHAQNLSHRGVCRELDPSIPSDFTIKKSQILVIQIGLRTPQNCQKFLKKKQIWWLGVKV